MTDEIIYCGYQGDKHSIHKTQDIIEAIFNASRPVIVFQIKAFLGLVTLC